MLADTIVRLSAHAGVIRALTVGVSEQAARWRPEPGHWSIVEIVNHLADEESEDFRTRVDYTLHRPDEPWPAIDPAGWVTERSYAERNLTASVERFLHERAKSVAWLGALEAPDWTRTYEHPRAGTLTARDVLASWVAHDHLHIRQLNRVHRAWLAQEIAPGADLDYAGAW